LTEDLMTRDTADLRKLNLASQPGGGTEVRFQPVDDLVAAIDSLVAAAVAA
jgi:hypothetical protein